MKEKNIYRSGIARYFVLSARYPFPYKLLDTRMIDGQLDNALAKILEKVHFNQKKTVQKVF